jgi:hypothetical protein
LYFFLDSTGREADDLRNSKSRLSSSFVFLNLKFMVVSAFHKVLNLGQMKAHCLFALEPSQLYSILCASGRYNGKDCHRVSINLFIVVVVTSS